MDRDKMAHIRQWILAVSGILLLAVGAISALLLLYGGGSWQSTARLEASRLSTIEMNELVGASRYQKSAQPSKHTVLASIGTVLHLPFVRPLQMLQSQLPNTKVTTALQSNGQNSLFKTLSNWETHAKKITLGWIPYNTVSNTEQMIKQSPGITVISPKWLSIKSSDGSITSRVQPQVVSYAHQHGIKVWALVDNQFRANLTHQTLSNQKSRENLVNKLVSTAKADKLDGLNIDFENIHSKDEKYFTQFVAELHQKLKPLHITLSVDVTKDIVFLQDNAAFFHAGLAANSDYVILMAYDEHWAGDPNPGPVADVPWVTSGVNDLLDTGVPANKLILGIPLYARFWYVHNNGQVSSEAVADANIGNVLAQHKAATSWKSNLGVAYARYSQPDGYEEAWYETGKTLSEKLSLVNHDGLAGIAAWSLNLSSTKTWQNVMDSLRQSLS
ncbi:glycosyl hydrolase family 18 protein [Alicyclobacillus sp. SO9]|uniref:glycosyl hydrolase family 18 protein n=1 Tax=Alicyclobacillus sp. SO9 TaxID=2665646 RepID=UPI0018E729D9|nr:glycosyl hydrolase family 18 protein [Alicyclobacillus sp. SO9]QQE76934.1 glycoside hydrolase [Alicyclobacillus sp. SO9]